MIIGLLILAAVAPLHFAKIHMVWEEIYSPQALGHDNECYILFEVRHYGWQGSYLAFAWEYVRGLLPIPPAPLKVLRTDTVVCHYANGTLSRHYVTNFRLGSLCLPHKGSLYYGGGWSDSNSRLPMWRWDGTEFVRISDKEAAEIEAAYIGYTERFTGEGWAKYYLGQFPDGEQQVPIKLDRYNLVLTLKSEERMTKKTLTLRGQGLKDPEEVLASSDGMRRHVDEQTYMNILESRDDH